MELKKCPFCGGGAEIKTVTRHVYNNLIVVKCTVCGASTKTFLEYKENLCTDAWNMRTEDCKCI